MSAEVRFLSVEDVLVIQANTIDVERGSPGLRDAGLLESAVLMPQQRFGGEYLHRGIPAMAAAYLFHIAQNHPFHDGNKRTAVLAALVFLDVNKVDALPDPDELEQATMAVAAGEMSKAELVDWMEQRVEQA